ncbi:PAS domain S-box protein [Tuwongella immobilis]|uniref:histidine kinase n=1 Tax=Tuwongella immobilis TaxID=692036 RepID=A0A6C2YP09_9BACT|nr:PAS domain S-box protein [Tuwongella immobilis]VIP02622.1 pas pac sensor hybrid histidine kinase : Signal transduction histidine kinase, nitrogen specific, NtrB OS=Desulfobulbus propionicus (strain ATCC 33891 / DSM 2032 / 1pr3) GN=Despr_1205 PE=4 SV=1: PAS: PAS_3: PAS_4: PAS_4: HATPase_c: Response_reg [Tuwongella immobilis]VTS01954.1 pas pac sensor hybrid histidine kinase : Signal transduction histidine kinase, nitrogen specific, NtrB OS=Desulfobulbus propionicus (strain ATCC 33891 / DSM 2032 
MHAHLTFSQWLRGQSSHWNWQAPALAILGIGSAYLLNTIFANIFWESFPTCLYFVVIVLLARFTTAIATGLAIALAAIVLATTAPLGTETHPAPSYALIVRLLLFIAMATAVGGLALSWQWIRWRLLQQIDSLTIAQRLIQEEFAARSLAEQNLRESESRYRRALHSSMVGIGLIDLQGVCLEANPALCDMFGYSETSLVGRSIFDLTHPDDRPKSQIFFNDCLHGDQPAYQFEKRYLHADGSIVHAVCSVSMVLDASGNPTSAVIQISDLTRQKRVEQQLAERESRLHKLAENIPNGAVFQIIVHPNGSRRFLVCSAGMAAITGIPLPDLVDDCSVLSSRIHPDDRKSIEQHEQQAIIDRKPMDVQIRMFRDDGSIRWLNFRSSPRPLPTGEVIWDGILADVTEYHQTLQQLMFGEARLKSILTSMPDTVFLLNSEAKFQGVYTSRPDLLPASESQLIGQSLFAMLPIDSVEFAKQAFEQLAATGQPQGFEFVLTRGSGTECFEASLSVCGLNEVLVIVRDVTGRRYAEAAMRESEARFQAFMDHIPLGAWILDRNSRVVYVNRFYGDMAGINPNVLIGRKAYDLYTPEAAEYHRANDLQVLQTNRPIDRLEPYLRSDGVRGEVLVVKFPIVRQDGERYIGAVALDITERTRFEHELRESERRLRSILDFSPTVISIKDLMGRYQFVNQRFVELFNRPTGSIIGRSASDLVPTEIADRWRETEVEVISTRKPMTFEETLPLSAGEHHFLSVVFPLIADDTTVYGICTIASDITKQKQDEAQKELITAQLQASDKLKSLGVLAGGLAHDFNNLLQPILGYTELLMNALPEDFAFRSMLPPITRAAQQSAQLCRQLLAYAGKGRFKVGPTNLNDAIAEMLELLRVTVSKRVTLLFQPAESLPLIEADRSQLGQVLLNLVINGSDAIGDVPGTVTIRTGCEYLDESQTRQLIPAIEGDPKSGSYVYVEVEDTGSGMTADVMKQIFEPFFTTKFTGRGLGMSAVLGIARGHSGGLTIHSQVGVGTRIRFSFPARYELSLQHSPPQNLHPAFPPNSLIYVVDDDPSVRDSACDTLQSLGYRVRGFSDATEAIEQFRIHASEISLVLSDLTMPGLSGEEIMHQLLQIRPSTPVILMSGYTETDLQNRFARLGFAAFLSKPFNQQELQQRLQEAANRTVQVS